LQLKYLNMQVYLIDPNRDFQKANPKLKFNATEKYHLHYYEWRCVYSENDSVFCWFVLVGKQSLLTNTICDSDSKDGYNAIIRIGKEYQDFSRENEFQLTITDPTVEGIKAILNRKSVIAPNLTNYEVYDRLQKIKNVGREEYPFPKICKSDLDYVEEFLLLENETFEKSLKLLVNNKLQALSNTLKNSYEQTEPLINELDNSLDIITKATKSIETVKTAADFVYNEMRCNQLLKEEVNRLNIELERANKTYDDLLLKNAELRKKLNSRK